MAPSNLLRHCHQNAGAASSCALQAQSQQARKIFDRVWSRMLFPSIVWCCLLSLAVDARYRCPMSLSAGVLWHDDRADACDRLYLVECIWLNVLARSIALAGWWEWGCTVTLSDVHAHHARQQACANEKRCTLVKVYSVFLLRFL
jgi:hypothetical protein